MQVLMIIIGSVLVLARCVDRQSEEKQVQQPVPTPAPGFAAYTSPQTCGGCHKGYYENHIKTAHHLTAMPATMETIKGSFRKGDNEYAYTPSILLSMEKRDSGLYQVVHFKGEEKRAMRFDIVIGSGKMGQSFLNWRDNKLFQLPITYFTEADQWSNSPGFPQDRVLIDRPVTSRCLECHTTYASSFGDAEMEPVEFDRNKMLFGVDCQKCHGPAAQHVTFHQQNPQEKTAKFIVNPAKLTRAQQIDMCALCHGGNIQKTKPSFEFVAGKNLSDYFVINDSVNEMLPSMTNVDVHGNQVALLKASKCFRVSGDMTCNTCHNSHENERGNLQLFSVRCMNCHDPEAANLKTATHLQAATLKKNCIDCHMPAQPSRSIAVFLQGEEIPKASKLRTHLIAIYADEARKNLIKNDK